MFYVGQKVEYIGKDFRGCNEAARCTELPVPGAIYTIRAEKRPGLYLVAELQIRHPRCSGEVPIERELLRPIVEHKTDISVFTEILRKHSKRTPVRAS